MGSRGRRVGKRLAGLYRTLIGSATINPLIFYTGKMAGYATWILLVLSLVGTVRIRWCQAVALDYAGYVLLALGLALSAVSMFNLGRSTALGLPAEKREIRTGGLYGWSRNPMYVGFDLMTLASVVYHANVYVGIAGMYSIAVYHLIILGEERYMGVQHGEAYREYRRRVRRYF